jgi:hypothetical protein
MDSCGFPQSEHIILAQDKSAMYYGTVDRAPAMAARGEDMSAGTEAAVLWPEDFIGPPPPVLWPEDFIGDTGPETAEELLWCYEINGSRCEFQGNMCCRPCALRGSLSGAHSGAHQMMKCVCRTCYRAGHGTTSQGALYWDAPSPAMEVTLQPLPADHHTGDRVEVWFISGASCHGRVVMRNSKDRTFGIKLEVGLFGRAAWEPEQVDQPSNLL